MRLIFLGLTFFLSTSVQASPFFCSRSYISQDAVSSNENFDNEIWIQLGPKVLAGDIMVVGQNTGHCQGQVQRSGWEDRPHYSAAMRFSKDCKKTGLIVTWTQNTQENKIEVNREIELTSSFMRSRFARYRCQEGQ